MLCPSSPNFLATPLSKYLRTVNVFQIASTAAITRSQVIKNH